MSEFKGNKFPSIFVGEIYGWNWAEIMLSSPRVASTSSSLNDMRIHAWNFHVFCLINRGKLFQFSVSCSRELISIQPKICYRQLKIHNRTSLQFWWQQLNNHRPPPSPFTHCNVQLIILIDLLAIDARHNWKMERNERKRETWKWINRWLQSDKRQANALSRLIDLSMTRNANRRR